MKRILAGIGWFVLFYVLALVVLVMVLALVLLRSLPAGASNAQVTDAATVFMQAHAALMSVLRWAAFLIALLAASLATLQGWLPGTRKRAA